VRGVRRPDGGSSYTVEVLDSSSSMFSDWPRFGVGTELGEGRSPVTAECARTLSIALNTCMTSEAGLMRFLVPARFMAKQDMSGRFSSSGASFVLRTRWVRPSRLTCTRHGLSNPSSMESSECWRTSEGSHGDASRRPYGCGRRGLSGLCLIPGSGYIRSVAGVGLWPR